MSGMGFLIQPNNGKCRTLQVDHYYSPNDVIVGTVDNNTVFGVVIKEFLCTNVKNNYIDPTLITPLTDLYLVNTVVKTTEVFLDKAVFRIVYQQTINKGDNINIDIPLTNGITLDKVIRSYAYFKDEAGYTEFQLELVKDNQQKINIQIAKATAGTMYIVLEFYK